MTNKSKVLKVLSFAFLITGFVILNGFLTKVNAQNDPFAKPGWARPRNPNPSPSSSSSSSSTKSAPKEKPKPVGPIVVVPPPIDARINYYKRLREEAATGGMELPKVTSVLTLEEMSVMGIFRTPRGYAAMVEAKPIKLSYTIYPGEKFFDGQLVAIEENRLVFRKVTKMSDGKFISSVENKALRQYSVQETVQGTAPIVTSGNTETAEAETPARTEEKTTTVPATQTVIISPVDEMNRQPQSSPKDAKDTTGRKGKKGTKVAKNKKP